MKKQLFKLLAVLALSLNSFGGSTMTPSVVDLPIVVEQVSNLTVEVSKKVDTNDLQSTTLGSEGIRQVGALGGYNLDRFLADSAARGVTRDYPVFTYTQAVLPSLEFAWTAGDVYSPIHGYYHMVAGSNTLTDNRVNYGYWRVNNPYEMQWTVNTLSDIENTIPVVTVSCAQGRILHVGDTVPMGEMPLRMDNAHRKIFPSLIVDGLNFSPLNYTNYNLNAIIQTAGTEIHNMIEINTHPSKNLTEYNVALGKFLIPIYRTNTDMWVTGLASNLPVDQWDNGSNLVSCVESNWYRGLLFSAANSKQMAYMYPQASYTNYADALAGADPDMPPGFAPYIPRCTAYIFMGGDTNLRTSADSWIDRRLIIQRGNVSTSSGGGSGAIPSLTQILAQSPNSGGYFIDGLTGLPSNDDQVVNKLYVDSKINNMNSGKAYVDPNGNDATAELHSSTLPFKTIQAAINAAANDTNRYIVLLSPGVYDLNGTNIIMKENVSLEGADIQGCIIIGAIYYPTNYMDISGSEIAKLSVFSHNEPSIVINAGADDAYAGIRSCWLRANYDNTVSEKSVVLIKRGLVEDYGTTYHELNILTTNGSVDHVSIFAHTTDTNNQGLSTFTAFAPSSILNCTDTNDEISLMHTYDNTDTACINECIAGNFNIIINHGNDMHNNKIKLVSHDNAVGSTLSMGNATRLYMDETNNCNLFMAFAKDGTGENVAIIRNNHVRVISGSSSNIWFGAATTTNDNIRIYDTEIIQKNFFNYYPKRYTAEGSDGSYYINTAHQNGDIILGGALDMFTPNSLNDITYNLPSVGHIKIYLDNTTGLEQPYYIDSTGTKFRICRDSVFLGYNTETNTLMPGEVVSITPGSTNHLQNIKRATCILGDQSLVLGIINTQNGVPAGAKAHVMAIGTTEATPIDTSMYIAGTPLYLSATTAGGFTNVPPLPPFVTKQIGWCGFSSTNGTIIVNRFPADVLGDQIPSYYATASNLVAETNRAYVAETNLSNRINIETNRAYVAETNLSNRINIETNRAIVAETNLQGQVTSATNRIAIIESNTQSWNNVAISRKFFANVGGAIQTFGGGTTDKVLYTNNTLNVGGTYSNSVARWIPGVSNVMIRISGNLNVDMANNSIAYIYVYKNGGLKCTVFSKRTTNLGEELGHGYSFVDITTNAADYYEIFANIAGGGAQLNGNNGNWWSGQIVY